MGTNGFTDHRKTFMGETPDTACTVLCDYCGDILHCEEHDIFWKDTANHKCVSMLEAERDALQAERDAAVERAKEASQYLAIETRHAQIAEAQIAKVEALVELLKEARSDLVSYIDHDYPEASRAQYPDVQRRWKRDMELCWKIDAALAAMKGGDT
jgi:hypothetical protein